jgi:hypothetical protein
VQRRISTVEYAFCLQFHDTQFRIYSQGEGEFAGNLLNVTYSTADVRVVGAAMERPSVYLGLGTIPGVELLDHAGGASLRDSDGQDEVDEAGDGGDGELHFD